MNWLIRLKYKIRFLMNYSKELNRRGLIEDQLAMIAQGKKPLPTREDCRITGLKLGTPKSDWPEEWK